MQEISAAEVQTWLTDGHELALLDVREPGQTGEGHILFSAPAPYSGFELVLPALVPNPAVRLVLCDDGDGVAAKAARRAEVMGYARTYVLAGGVQAWAALGRTLFKGVNVPSKAFGELVEEACHTPHLSATELARRQAAGDDLVVVDGRSPEEYRRMTIPGSQSCPNGELPLRIGSIAPSPETTIVVNCAGRTRSIIGAQTLRDVGVPNPVLALENGTQGWKLDGLELLHGAEPESYAAADDLTASRTRALALADTHGATAVAATTVSDWLSDQGRTTFVLDIRTIEERNGDAAAIADARARLGVPHAPGGQLIQATDQWVGVRNARIVVVDDGDIRAPVVASWLRRLGHGADWLSGGVSALAAIDGTRADPGAAAPLARISAQDLAGRRDLAVLDIRSSEAYRQGHIPGATWTVRPRITAVTGAAARVLVASTPTLAALAARDLAEAGVEDIRLLEGGMSAWVAAGLPIEATPAEPADEARIDYLFFVHDRHHGNLDAARAYLAWETGLIAQLDARERAVFRV